MIALTKFPKVRYSMMEYRLFDVMPKNGRKFNSADLAEARREMGQWDVKYPLKNVTVTMNRLIDKVDANREAFRIAKEERYPGHSEVEYWVEPRKPRKKANGK